MTEKDYQLVRSYQVFRSRKQWAVNVVGTDSDGQSIKSTGHSCSNIFLIIINHHRRRRQSMIAASIAASIAAAAAAASWLMNYRIFLQHESITMTRVIVIVRYWSRRRWTQNGVVDKTASIFYSMACWLFQIILKRFMNPDTEDVRDIQRRGSYRHYRC